jgi:putative nucleotidyltransferase with HDIG domain
MERLCVLTDTPSMEAAIRRQVEGLFDLHCLGFDQIRGTKPSGHVLIDVDLGRSGRAIELKEWLRSKPEGARIVVAIDKASHLQSIQATALGASGILHRPFERRALVRMLLGDLNAVGTDPQSDLIRKSPGVGEALDSLRNIFDAACLGTPLNIAAINSTGDTVILRMEEAGLGSWLDSVRRHHSQTYQHCLIVTGVTIAFAQHLGFSRADQRRMSLGAMLHDIGKARIPLAILEKPAALTADEIATMSQHPEYGLEALKTLPGLSSELQDIVVHHHEYLDGSGYPHRLRGSEISDPVRIVTICDVFGALIERRAYKPPLTCERAYQLLLEMGNKLDKDLVREFGFTTNLRFESAA